MVKSSSSDFRFWGAMWMGMGNFLRKRMGIGKIFWGWGGDGDNLIYYVTL